MTNSTNWDVNKYYDPTEPAHHWELRQTFMKLHQDRFPEDKLVSLARTFTNIEFLGCRYDNELMIQIAELSKDVAKEYRESKKNKLQRTFVSASSAAQNKVSGSGKR